MKYNVLSTGSTNASLACDFSDPSVCGWYTGDRINRWTRIKRDGGEYTALQWCYIVVFIIIYYFKPLYSSVKWYENHKTLYSWSCAIWNHRLHSWKDRPSIKPCYTSINHIAFKGICYKNRLMIPEILRPRKNNYSRLSVIIFSFSNFTVSPFYAIATKVSKDVVTLPSINSPKLGFDVETCVVIEFGCMGCHTDHMFEVCVMGASLDK